MHLRKGFTLIELLVVIAIIAILAVVVVLTLNPAELLRQSRDANRVNDIATLSSALNLYMTDQGGASSFSLGVASNTYPSVPDPAATSTNACASLGLPSWNASSGQAWLCSASSMFHNVNGTGWIPVNFSTLSSGSPIGSLPVDPVNQTSSGLFYAYNTNGTQFAVTANLESQKYKSEFGTSPQTNFFPEVVSGGTPSVSALYNATGLIGYWPLEEGIGSSTIDQSGNGANALWYGNTTGGTYYGAGKVGNFAGVFDGSTNYLFASSTLTLPATNPSFTIAMWVKTNGAPSTDESAEALMSTSQLGRLVFRSNGTVLGNYKNTLGTGIQTNPLSFTFSQWTFVVLEYNGATLSMYVNGPASTSVANGGVIPSGGVTSFTMGSGGGTYQAFAGSIDDARVYNRALSPAEIVALYNAEK